MLDQWDKHPSNLNCEINGKIVAAGRIVCNNVCVSVLNTLTTA